MVYDDSPDRFHSAMTASGLARPTVAPLTLPQLILPPLPEEIRWSVSIREVSTDVILAEHTPDRTLPSASLGKMFLLIEAARQLECGELDPAERLAWHDDDMVADSGVWYRLDQRDFTIVDLCRLIGLASDNVATNVLLRHLGLPAVTSTTQALGFTQTALLDRVRESRTPDTPPTLSQGNARDYADLMARLSRGEIFCPAVSAKVLCWLSANTDLSMVAGAFGLDPLAHTEPDRGFTVVNKTGTIPRTRGDIGLINDVLSYAVLADWDGDQDLRDLALATMRTIGVCLRTHLSAA